MSLVIYTGILAGAVPAFLAIHDPFQIGVNPSGVWFILIGLLLLLWSSWDLYKVGKATVLPWSKPDKLVVSGLYRFSRNPVHMGLLIITFGWALMWMSPLIVFYFMLLNGFFTIMAGAFEEPRLKKRFKKEWKSYSNRVPRWLLRNR
jgi:protein-S-isoprenylcysteine O-methyltransferase Ste14